MKYYAKKKFKVNRRGKPITVRGVTYDSHHAAARALNLSVGTIYLAKKRGTVDGLGMTARTRAAVNHYKMATPTRINGVHYPSIQAAANALNINRSTLYRVLEEGLDVYPRSKK